MGKWDMIAFEDMFVDETKYGRKIPKEAYQKDGTYPIIDQGQEYIAGYTDNDTGLYSNIPAIIFGDHTRAIKYVNFPFFLGADGVKLLKSKVVDVDYRFLYYCLKSARIPDTGYNRHFKWLKELRIPLPPLPIQQKIADILDRAGALIEKRKAQIEKLDLLIKSQFIEMFGDPVTNPMGWDVKRLREVFKVRSSKRVYQSEQTNYGVPFLRVSDLTNRINDGVDSCNLFMAEELYEAYEKAGNVPKADDILVTSRGTLGLCYIVRNTDKFYFQDGMISWLSKHRVEVSSNYIKYLFCADDIKRQIERASAGSTVGYLSLANLENLNVMFPPLALQTQFTAFVERVEAQKAKMKQGLELMELENKSLMQKCFSGEMF